MVPTTRHIGPFCWTKTYTTADRSGIIMIDTSRRDKLTRRHFADPPQLRLGDLRCIAHIGTHLPVHREVVAPLHSRLETYKQLCDLERAAAGRYRGTVGSRRFGIELINRIDPEVSTVDIAQ